MLALELWDAVGLRRYSMEKNKKSSLKLHPTFWMVLQFVTLERENQARDGHRTPQTRERADRRLQQKERRESRDSETPALSQTCPEDPQPLFTWKRISIFQRSITSPLFSKCIHASSSNAALYVFAVSNRVFSLGIGMETFTKWPFNTLCKNSSHCKHNTRSAWWGGSLHRPTKTGKDAQ